MTISISKKAWDRVDVILKRSSWMRFTLSFARGQWGAVFSHEKGKVYGTFTSLDAEDAIAQAAAEAEGKTLHLVEGDAP